MSSKILKYLFLAISLLLLIGSVYYSTLSNRHKAIVKKKLLYGLHLVDNTWTITNNETNIEFITPTMVIDNIYKSMEGPQVTKSFQIDSKKSDLVFINYFNVEALQTDEKTKLANDFICHTNIDYFDGEHYSHWQLDNRIGEQYPRLTSMSNGIETYQFPKGFGFPVFTDENLFLATQTLNHNITDKTISVKHKINIGYSKLNDSIKPLRSKTIFMMLPFDYDNPFKGPTESNPNMCLPIETKNHTYKNNGMAMSGHWVIFPEQKTYRFDVSKQLNLKAATTLHHIATHLHPFAERLDLRDSTTDSIIFSAKAKNYADKIGLKNVSVFSNENGVTMHPNHNYELVLQTNNTSGVNQDMMASMFLFFYDKDMDEKIKTYRKSVK